MRKIKLLFVLPNLEGGGAERVVLNIIRRLDRSLFSVTLFLFEPKGVFWKEIPKDVSIVHGGGGLGWRIKFPIILLKFLKTALSHDVLIGAVELTPIYLSYFAGLILNKPVVGIVHAVFGEYGSRLRKIHRLLGRLVYPRVDKLVFVSSGAALSMEQWLRRDLNNYQVIHNFIDESSYLVHESGGGGAGGNLSEIFSLPTVVAVGRLSKEKGFDILIRAHAVLVRRRVKHNLLILGEGPLRGDLEDLTNRLGVSRSVLMPGFVSRPSKYLERADLFVLPSYFEGLPTALLEAMTSGLPVIATRCPGGVSEILENGKYGWLVPVGDPESLADAISRFLQDGKLRDRYGKFSKERAKDFTPEAIIPLWNKLFEEVGRES